MYQFLRVRIGTLSFVIDSSGSMQWNDKNNYRIDKAKEIVDLLESDDRSMVIHFDDGAKLFTSKQDPFTVDKEAVKTVLGKIPAYGGTKSSAGLALAINYYENFSEDRQKIMILLIDGENNETSQDERAKELSEEARDKNIVIHTVGLGSETGVYHSR